MTGHPRTTVARADHQGARRATHRRLGGLGGLGGPGGHGGLGSNAPAGFALLLAAAGTVWRVIWQLGGQPTTLSPIGPDLVLVDGWSAVVLCALAALAAALLATGWHAAWLRRAALLRGTALLCGAALLAAGAMLLLDVVGGLLPGLGIGFYPLGALSRLTCVTTGVLLIAAVRADVRATRGGCATCGRVRAGTGALDQTPRWAFVAAYAAMTGCVVRAVAQIAVGIDESPLSAGGQTLVFEVGFVLGGTLLPLASVHRFGMVWPRWVPALHGRRVPRPLVLWPGAGIGVALIVYFGVVFGQMIAERLAGRNPFPPTDGTALPEAFFWVAVPAYLTWGIGLAFAAFAYHRRTTRRCPDCGL